MRRARVDLTIESGKVVSTPIESPPRHYTLDELLAGITEENLHGETFAVAPVGNEIISILFRLRRHNHD